MDSINQLLQNFNTWARLEQDRVNASRTILDQINNRWSLFSHLLVADTEVLQNIRKKETYTLLGTFVGSVSLSRVLFANLRSRIAFFGLVAAGVKLAIKPHFICELVEAIATEPTEAGQVARSVYLFECPHHPNTKEYERLSREYKKFMQLRYSN